jgi:predicted nucleic acid-binding protein
MIGLKNMKIFLDTNILFDVLTKREPFYYDSLKIWTLAKEDITEAYISAISVTNLYYIIKKIKGQKIAENFVDELINDFEIVPLTKDILHQARTIKGKDYEDLIQYFSAIHLGCELLLTRNKKDFPKEGIIILSPSKFLKDIENSIQ